MVLFIVFCLVWCGLVFLHSDCKHSLTKPSLNAGKCHLHVKKLREASLCGIFEDAA